jgi:hypothetical protein
MRTHLPDIATLSMQKGYTIAPSHSEAGRLLFFHGGAGEKIPADRVLPASCANPALRRTPPMPIP